VAEETVCDRWGGEGGSIYGGRRGTGRPLAAFFEKAAPKMQSQICQDITYILKILEI
jgi:hypothetical protein